MSQFIGPFVLCVCVGYQIKALAKPMSFAWNVDTWYYGTKLPQVLVHNDQEDINK